jgi:hypothetical protein
MSFFSTAVRSGAHALRWNTPWPAMSSGRSAVAMRSTTFAMSAADGTARDSVRYLERS